MQVSSALVMHLLCVCVCPRSTCANCRIWSHTRRFFLFVKMKRSQSCVQTKFGVRSQQKWTHQQVWAASCVLLLFFYVVCSDPVSLWVAHGRHVVTRQRFEVGIRSRRENLTDGWQRLRWSDGGGVGLGLPWSGCRLRNGLVPTSKIRPSPGSAEASH